MELSVLLLTYEACESAGSDATVQHGMLVSLPTMIEQRVFSRSLETYSRDLQ